MKKFKRTRKILALLLSLSLITGMMPATALSAFAAEEQPVDATLVFTDLHSMYNGESSTGNKGYKKDLVTNFMTTLKNAGYNFSSVTSGGDAFSSNSTTNTGYMDTITGYIQSVLGDVPVNYVWSDHDRGAVNNATEKKALDKTSHLTYGAGEDGIYGTEDDANYYVYALSMADICSYDRYKAGFNTNARVSSGFTATIDEAIANFEADAAKLNKDRPLFIVSHQPLFDRRNDNAFAEQWFDAINKVAEDMDVAFFFGHNHKYDKAEDYYYAKGSTMPVATDEGWQGYETGAGYQGYLPTGDLKAVEKELNFTHMCAGYMDPGTTGTQTSTTREGAVMAVTIYEDSINYCTYGQNGVYTDNYSVNETVTRDHAPVDSPDEPVTVPDGFALDRIEVVNQGVTKYYVGEPLNKEGLEVVAVYTKENEADFRMNLNEAVDSTEGYTVSGYDANKAGKQYLTVSYQGCVGKFAVEVFQKTFVNETGDVTVEFSNYGITSMKATSKVKPVDGYKAYVTYDIIPIGYTQGDEATVTLELDTKLFDTTRPVSVLDEGKCIATENIVGGKITFTTNHFSEYDVAQASLEDATWLEIPGSTTYEYTLDTDGVTANKNYLIASAGSGTVQLLTNNNGSAGNTAVTVSNSKITIEDESKVAWVFSGATNGTVKNGNTTYVNLGSSGVIGSTRSLTFSNQKNGAYRIYRSSPYYLRYSNGSWSRTSTATNVYLFEKTKEITTPSGYVTLVGQNQFPVNVGTKTVTEIEAMIRSNIHVHTATDSNGTGAQEKNDYTLTAKGTVNPDVVGTYSYTVKYGTVELGTITVNVVTKIAESVSVNPKTFTVERDTPTDTVIGTITVKYPATETTPAETEEVALTIAMLQGQLNTKKNGTYSNLSVTYGGKTVEDLTLKVVNKTGDDINDFPTYPNPGSIDVKKSAKGVDFQNTGVARVELSASGLPVNSGADVIIMLDTSSSMQNNTVSGTTTTRAAVLEASLKKLIEQFRTSGPGGTPLNLKVAIANFNGYYRNTNTPYDVDANDKVGADNGNQNPSANPVKTGSGQPNAGAFVSIESNTLDSITLNYTSGTNYDYAFDAIYQMGSAIKAENGDNQRPLYVIFMSDGIPFQWNYYTSNRDQVAWNSWLTGEYKSLAEVEAVTNNDTHSYYYNFEDTDNDGHLNEHRMANAIKGDPERRYEVVRKSDAGIEDIISAGKDHLYTVPGLGASLFAVNFAAAAEHDVTLDTVIHAISSIATKSSGDTKYYYEATSAADLDNAFSIIGTEIGYAATNARYVDQMGSNFNLQMNPSIKTNATVNTGGYTPTNTDITITTHPIYTEAQVGTTVNNHNVTIDDVGKPYANGTTIETVRFTANGDKITATTNVGGYEIPNSNGTGKVTVTANSTNILVDGIIYGKNFFYNSNTTSKKVTLANGTTIDLPAETFYWNIGTINEVQYTMAYTVVLDGALDGAVSAGSYDTNNFAILYYTNHEGNEVSKSVASPSLAWKGAQVSYAFYLVNDDGEPVFADGTKAPNFLQAYKVTQPVVYKNVELNKTGGTTLNAAALAVLPQGYELFAPTAEYTVTIASGEADGANVSGWNIVNDAANTTYVMGYAENNAYSKVPNVTTDSENSNYKEEYDSYDFTHTTVYFAVKWVVGAVPDTVVIDYGLDVDVDVLANDMFSGDITLAGVGAAAVKPEGHGESLANGFGNTAEDPVGTASVINGKVRYSLNKENSMKLNDAKTISYAVDYEGATNPGFYYGDLTIIPATTIYYEDEYLTLTTYKKENGAVVSSPGWPTDSQAATDTQAEDRPGYFSLGTVDANNIYGFDGAYEKMSTHSMNNAAMIHVDANQYGTAEFDFFGTGFDVASVTSNKTGTMVVQVYDADGKLVVKDEKNLSTAVDTYYGYVYGFYQVVYEKGENGLWTKVSVGEPADKNKPEDTKADLPTNAKAGDTATLNQHTWKPVKNDPNALYQVPVMKIAGLPYGQYKVKITALYYSTFDSTTDPGYDLYLDAIRIYNPAGTTDEDLGTTIKKAYEADGEYAPSYYELRNQLIRAAAIKNLTNNESAEGIVFIDGNESLSDGTAINGSAVTDYEHYGPNNELYLAKGQAVAFDLNAPSREGYDTVVRIGMKTVGGASANAELWNVRNSIVDGTSQYIKYNTVSQKLETATDMFYDISLLNGGTVVITNSGEDDSILSITDIKTTYRPIVASTAGLSEQTAPSKAAPAMMFSVSKNTIDAAVMTLKPVVVSEPDTPVTPEQPDTPVVPDTPVTPEQPDTPTVPDKPEVDEPEVDKPVVDEAEPEKPAADPAKIVSVKTDKQTYTQGDKVKVTVTTNSAATKVKVGTKTLKTFKTKNGKKTWTTTVKASKIGKLSINAVAYNKEGTATKKVTKKVTVKQFAPKKFNVTLSKSKVKKGAKYTVTVKTSTSVKYVKVNGKKITKFTTDKKKTTRTFKITYKATKVGKKNVKVVSYNKAGYASKAKSKTVIVNRK